MGTSIPVIQMTNLPLDAVVLATEISASAGDPNQAQKLVAGVMFAVLAYFVVKQYYGARTAGTDAEQRRQLKKISGQMEAVTPTIAYVSFRDSREELLTRLKALFQDDDVDDTSVRSAVVKTVKASAGALPDAPSLAIRVGAEAVVYAVLGSIALVTVEVWSQQLTSIFTKPDAPSVSVGERLGELVEVVMSVLGGFPMSEFIFAFGLSYVMQLGELLYNHWLAVSLMLLVGAVAIALLDRRLSDHEITDTDVLALRFAAKNLIGVTAITITTGILLNTVGQFVFGGILAELLALAGTMLAGAYLSRNVLRESYRRTRVAVVLTARTTDTDLRRLVIGYASLRVLLNVVSVVVVPVMVAYLVTAISDGKIRAVASILASAPTESKAVLGVVALMIAVVTLSRSKDSFRDAKDSWVRAVGRKAAKVALFAGVIPFIFGLIAFTAMMYLIGSATAGVVAGVLVMFASRLAYFKLRMVKYQLSGLEAWSIKPARALVEGFVLEDADGDEIYVIRISGAGTYAHRDPELLVETVVTDVLVPLFEEGEPEPTVEEEYWQSIENGLVDWQKDGERKVKQRVTERIIASLQKNDKRLHIEDLNDITEHWPEDVFEDRLDYLLKNNKIGLRRGGDIVVLVD